MKLAGRERDRKFLMHEPPKSTSWSENIFIVERGRQADGDSRAQKLSDIRRQFLPETFDVVHDDVAS